MPEPRSGSGMLSALAHGVVVAALAASLLITTAAPSTAQNTATVLCDTAGAEQFSDVADNDYAASYILCAKALKLTKGTQDGTFKPNSTLTRAQMAAFLIRLLRDILDNPCPDGTPHDFSDITGNFAAADIACLYTLGITKGTTPITYSPAESVTTAQVTRFTARLLNKAKPGTCNLADNELAQAATCLTSHNIAPNTTEATTPIPTPRAQMAVYLIGAWHNAAGRGLPPKPPAKPVDNSDSDQTIPNPLTGDVPDIDMLDLSTNETVNLQSMVDGKLPVLLWFWVEWCPTCKRHASSINQFAQDNSHRVRVVGVGGRQSLQAARQFVADYGIAFTMLWGNNTSDLWRHYGVLNNSSVWLLDRNGNRVGNNVYNYTQWRVEQLLASLE